MSSQVGPMPSGPGEITSAPFLPYAQPKSVEEQAKEQDFRKSQWEEQEEKRRESRARLTKELQEAEAKAEKSKLRLPVVASHLRNLLACKGTDAQRQISDPIGYSREIGYTKSDIQALETDLRKPEKLRQRLAHLDSQLVGDELALVQSWNMSGEGARRLLLKLLGIHFVDTAKVVGENLDISRPLPTTRE